MTVSGSTFFSRVLTFNFVALTALVFTLNAQSAPLNTTRYDGQDLFRIPEHENFNALTLPGYWQGRVEFDGDIDETLRIKVTENSVKIAKRCRSFFNTSYVAVEVPIQITPHTIEILWGDSDSRYDDDMVCSVALEKTPALTYRIYNGRLYYDGFASHDPFTKFSDL